MLLVHWRVIEAAAPDFTRQTWHVADGLPEDTVQSVAQTADGYLLVGTTGGLAKFDGSRFHLYTQRRAAPLEEASIFCMLKARDGSIWLGTEGNGLVHMDLHGIRLYASADGLSDLFVRALLEDHAGRIWVGTDNGLFQVQNDRVRRVNTSPLVDGLAVHAIMEDRTHRVWVGGSQLIVFDDAEPHASTPGMHLLHLPGRDSLARIKTLLQTTDGTIWAGTVDGLDRMTLGRFKVVPQISGTVRSLYETHDGTLWIGTIGHGLWRYASGRFLNLDSNGLLPSKTVLSVYEDDADQVWIGTQEGLVRLSRTSVSLLPLPGGTDPDFATVAADTDGTIWAVFSRVFAIRDGTARQYRFPQMPNVPVRSVFRSRDHTLWIGTDGDGVYHLEGNSVRHFAAPTLANNFVRVFLQDHVGNIWVGLDDGLSEIRRDGSVRNFGMKDGLAYFSTRALLEDGEGDLWIGTEKGVSHMHAGVFVHDFATRSMATEKIWSILQDSTGAIWFGTRNHGLFRYFQGQLQQYTTAEGLASNSIYQLLEAQGLLWISSPNTISSLHLSQMNGSAPVAQLAVESREMPYEAAGAQLYGGRQPSGCISADGSIWFPSSKGVLRVLPQADSQTAAPRAILLSAVVDGRALEPTPNMVLPASAARLAIGFTPLTLRSQEDLRFRYQLSGVDRGWTYAGGDRLASYTNLAAGKYKFTVEAFELSNPAVFTRSVLSFEKSPFFYETRWFAFSSVAAVFCIAWLIYFSRVRVLRLRFKAVLAERGRIAREMHDTIIQGCTSVSALLEALSSMARTSNPLEQELLEHARTQVRTTVQEAREAVWDLRRKDDSVQDLDRAIEVIAENAGRDAGIAVQCKREGRPFPIPGPPARELLMVVREAVYNAALHGRPQQIEVEVSFSRSTIAVLIRDDGVGFDVEKQRSNTREKGKLHYGIAGMHERIERMGGELVITSEIDQGTRVRFVAQRSHLQAMANGRAEKL